MMELLPLTKVKPIAAGFVAMNGRIFTEQQARVYNDAAILAERTASIRGIDHDETRAAERSRFLAYCVCAGINPVDLYG